GASGDPEAVPAARALSMATFNGARALGLDDETGSIEPGKSADFAAVSLDGPESLPVHNVISQLVYAAGRHQVTDVWVAGRRVVRDRRLETLERDEIVKNAALWQTRLSEQAVENRA
ncbi:MAG: amidohydrolase family protein, partial [Wenzhouxiangella sp.]